jgi:hypothetical protein
MPLLSLLQCSGQKQHGFCRAFRCCCTYHHHVARGCLLPPKRPPCLVSLSSRTQDASLLDPRCATQQRMLVIYLYMTCVRPVPKGVAFLKGGCPLRALDGGRAAQRARALSGVPLVWGPSFKADMRTAHLCVRLPLAVQGA